MRDDEILDDLSNVDAKPPKKRPKKTSQDNTSKISFMVVGVFLLVLKIGFGMDRYSRTEALPINNIQTYSPAEMDSMRAELELKMQAVHRAMQSKKDTTNEQ